LDKYEYKVRAEEINALIEKRQYAEAVKIADTIDWSRVKSHLMLCKISDLYKINRRYEESREILLLADERCPENRKIIYNLCELSIKLEDIVQAVEYYKEFAQIAPKDTGRFILQYRLYEAQDVSLEERIAVLEDYKKRDYREKWAYELAYLYHRIGLETRCIEECDELILWFGEGRYVIKAMELKMLHAALTPEQQEKYDQYKKARSASIAARKEEAVAPASGQTANINIEGESQSGAMTLPISIKSVNAANVPTAKIPSKKVNAGLKEAEREEPEELPEAFEDTAEEVKDAERIAQEAATKRLFDRLIKAGAAAVEDAGGSVGKEETEPVLGEAESEEKPAEESDRETKEENEPVQGAPLQEGEKSEDEMDIQIKPIDVGEYNTINLQQELAKNLAKMLAEEDMDAVDATKALPIDSILESTDPDLFKNVTNQTIRTGKTASMLGDSQEMSPITEEELLASLEEKPKTADQFGNTKILMEKEQEAAARAEEAKKAKQEEAAVLEDTVTQPLEDEQSDIPETVFEDAVGPEAGMQEPVLTAVQESVPSGQEELSALEEPQQPAEAPRLSTGVTQAIDASLVNMSELTKTAKDLDEKEEPAAIQTYKTVQTPEGGILKPVTGVTQTIDASVLNLGELLSTAQEKHFTPTQEPTEEVVETQPAAAEQETVGEQPVSMEEQSPIQPSASEQQADTQAEAPSAEKAVSEQITGQLSFTDIMAEWEETKKASEEKLKEEMRQRMLKHTGSMFEDFDSMARASVTSDLNLISPMEDVFSETKEPGTEVENALGADIKENEESEDSGFIHQFFQDAQSSLQEEQRQPVIEEPDDEPIHTQVFNTEEIKGIEEHLLNNLQKESSRIEPELVMPVIPDTGVIPPVLGAVPAPETAPVMETPSHEPEPEYPEVSTAQESPVMAETAYPQDSTASVTPVYVPETSQQPVSAEMASAGTKPQLNSLVTTGEIQFTDLTEDAAEVKEDDTPAARELTEKERELFGAYLQSPQIEKQIIYAIDHISLASKAGNVLISGMAGAGSTEVIKNLVKIVQSNDDQFSKKVAKITGSILDKKDIRATLDSVENGALIVEKAGELTPHVCQVMSDYVKELPPYKSVLLFMEDTRGNIDKMVSECPALKDIFDIRIDLMALDNDGLVNVGKEYAKEQEYSIDEMGMLALYTRIADMQTNDHHVTIQEVKEIVDEAIANAGKKSVSHIAEVLLGKRFDADNNIVLREKDFMKDR
jgi:hypothetical protein